MGVPGQPATTAVSGEGTVERPLGVREAQDIAKAEAAVEPAVAEQQAFVQQTEANIKERLAKSIAAGGDTSWIEGSNAFKYFRVAPLIQEYTRLKEVIAKAADRNQKTKNAKELETIRNALLESGPEMSQVVRNLDTNPNTAQAYIDAANKAGRDEFATEAKARAEALPEREPKRAIDASAKRRVHHELHAAALVEEPFSDNRLLRRHGPQHGHSRGHIGRHLLRAPLIQGAFLFQPTDGGQLMAQSRI